MERAIIVVYSTLVEGRAINGAGTLTDIHMVRIGKGSNYRRECDDDVASSKNRTKKMILTGIA
jgi:hypothetical protein